MGTFTLNIAAGSFTDSEIIVMLGQNGTGKTTFIRMLAGISKPDAGGRMPELNVSYKPQKIAPSFDGSVRSLFHKKIRDTVMLPQFNTDVLKPLNIDDIIDQDVRTIGSSGVRIRGRGLGKGREQPARWVRRSHGCASVGRADRGWGVGQEPVGW